MYTIKVERNGAGYKRFTAILQAKRNGAALEWHGNSIRPLLSKCAVAIEEHTYGLAESELAKAENSFIEKVEVIKADCFEESYR